MAKKRGQKGHPIALRQLAEKRLALGENVRELAAELRVSWRTLYRWRKRSCTEELQVAKKRGQKGHPTAVRQLAEKRLALGENVKELAKEIGVSWETLYRWRRKLDPSGSCAEEFSSVEVKALEERVQQLSRLLTERTLELDFFRGALQKVEARRQRSISSGEMTSTSKSGK